MQKNNVNIPTLILLLTIVLLLAFTTPQVFASNTGKVSLFGISSIKTEHLGLLATFLIGALLFYFASMWAISQKGRKNLETALYKDSLTGYDNYKKFLEAAPKFLQENADNEYCVAYINMQSFKYVNDIFGNEEGDFILISLSHLFESALVGKGLWARVNADHFVVLAQKEEIDFISKKIAFFSVDLSKRNLENKDLYDFVFNAGVYKLKKGDTNIEKAVERANYARATIKAEKHHTFVYYDENMRREIMEKKEFEKKMREAYKNREFVPYFQPKVDVRTGKIIGSEALVRWVTPYGMKTPAMFLPQFEKNGFITYLDFYMLDEVCRAIREWLNMGLPVKPVSVNFSRLHLSNPEFPDRIYNLVTRYGVPTNLIEIEITETVAMSNKEKFIRIANKIRDYGFKISVDDFGTGYSSLSSLQDLPMDILKFDKSLLDSGIKGGMVKGLVSNMVSVVQDYKIGIVCEGVETREHLKFIKAINCNYAQGYYFAQPMTKKEYELLLIKDLTLPIIN